MVRHPRHVLIVPLLVALALPIGNPSMAFAANEDRAMAIELFERGRSLAKDGDYAAALAQFQAAAKVMHTFGILLNVAECQEKLGRTASAWAAWREARAVAADAHRPDDEAMAAAREALLEPELPRMTIVVPKEADVAGLEVKRDGGVVPREAWGAATAIDPGTHTIEASAPGHAARAVRVAVLAKDRPSVTIAPLDAEPARASAEETREPAPIAPVAPPRPAEAETPEPAAAPAGSPPNIAVSDGSGQRVAGWILAGIGIAGAGAGIAVALVGQNQHDDAVATDLAGNVSAAQSKESQANTTKTIGYVTIGAGGAFLVSGLLLVLTAHSSSRASISLASVSLSPWVAPSAVGATLGRTW